MSIVTLSFSQIEEILKESALTSIAVDFDKTITLKNTMISQILEVRDLRKYLHLLRCLLRGKKEFKEKLSLVVPQLSSPIQVREGLVNWLKHLSSFGYRIIVISASEEIFVKRVIQSIGLNCDVFGTNTDLHLKGHKKLIFLNSLLGARNWAYIGDSLADIPIWKGSRIAIAVNLNFYKMNRVRIERVELICLDKI